MKKLIALLFVTFLSGCALTQRAGQAFDIEHKPFFHFLPDPGFAETGKMRYKIEREMTTFGDLVDEATIFNYDKQVMDQLQEMNDQNKLGYSSDINNDFMPCRIDVLYGYTPALIETSCRTQSLIS